uniref:Cytochrome P450 n=1 Tax=Glossina pallidipes TaxID=7398 RepID=A0A1A9Z404_GLOPL
MIALLVITAVIALLVWHYLHMRNVARKFSSQGIARPPLTLPILGDALLLLGVSRTEFPFRLKDLFDRFGNIYHVWIGPFSILMVADADYYKVILRDAVSKPFVYTSVLKKVIGDGLIVVCGEEWRARRKMLNPAFHIKLIESFTEVFDEHSRTLTQRLQQHADGKSTFDIFPIIADMTLGIIFETTMGFKTDPNDLDFRKYCSANQEFIFNESERMNKPWLLPRFAFCLLRYRNFKKSSAATAYMRDFHAKIIQKKRQELEETNKNATQTGDVDDKVSGPKRQNFLEILLTSSIDGKPVSDDVIQDEIFTIIMAGSDTSGHTLCYALYLLSRHPDIQQKLFLEIFSLYETDSERSITMQDLSKLKYLECVIKETLRVYPTIPFYGRVFDEDIVADGKIIPGGTTLIICPIRSNENPEYFPEPKRFNPERFNDENINKIPEFAFAPFSAGPRGCIGPKFAMMEIKCALVRILLEYELLPFGDPPKPFIYISYQLENGLHLGLKPRKYDP